MSHKKVYEAGQKLTEHLAYVAEAEKRGRHRYVRCTCSCGTEKDFKLDHIRSGATTSCGCAGRDNSAKARTTHGATSHELYGTWWQMLERCENPKNSVYAHYGERGISVCDEWRDRVAGFAAFTSDMGERPAGCTLDRIDNDKGYSKENCEWAKHSVQVRNRAKSADKTSRFKGVSWDARGRNWRANIRIDGKQTYLGTFKSEEAAFRAYSLAYEKYVNRRAPRYFEATEGDAQ